MASQNYTLGRGRVYFDRFETGTKTKTGERYLGNTTEFNLNVTSESLDHYNADEGLREKDDSVILEVVRKGSVITDEVSVENLALFFLGEASVITEAGGAVTAEAITNVQQGLYYQLGVDATNPSGVRDVTSVVVKVGATTMTVNTDYTVDLELARIQIVAGGGINNDDDLAVDYTVNASTRDQIVTAGTIIEGALKFVSANPKGTKRDYYFPYVKLSPSGDLSLKGQEWQTLSFDVEALKLSDAVEAIYIDGRPA